MSDMSRHHSLPPAADHARHDPALVAQLAAGDALTPPQLDEARRLVQDCRDCAALAADLSALAAAVAREPVPPRRRDFTLAPEQAERLRGNAVTRFLRRLSLPTARAFQPAAAAVLSLGLLFVVAGYAWPGGGAVTVPSEPSVTTSGEGSPMPATAGTPAEASALVEVGPDDLAAADEAAIESFSAQFLESLSEHQAGTSERSSQKSLTTQDEEPEADGAQREMAEVTQMAAPMSEAADDALGLAQSADGDVAEAYAADALEEAGSELHARALGEVVEPESTAAAGAAPASANAQLLTVDAGPDERLIVLGLILAAGGAGLLLLGWLVRRTRDPLLR